MCEKVCVTGANGYLASHIILQLLENGYHVNATVRDPSNTKKMGHLLALPGAAERLRLFKADLLQDGSFDEALKDCVGLFHCASPFFIKGASKEGLLDPAVQGTVNILRSASCNPNIKRVILTSSTAAVYADFGQRTASHVYIDDDWSDVDTLAQKEHWYALGKTLAEKEAHTFVKNLGDNATFDLVVMCPTWILGPMLQPELNESSRKIYDYIKGKIKSIPNASKTLVDVRDVAQAHILGYKNKAASGRYLLMSVTPFESEICDSIRRCVPSAMLPSDISVEPTPPGYGPLQPARCKFDVTKAKSLGVVFRGLDEMVEDTINSFRQHGLL